MRRIQHHIQRRIQHHIQHRIQHRIHRLLDTVYTNRIHRIQPKQRKQSQAIHGDPFAPGIHSCGGSAMKMIVFWNHAMIFAGTRRRFQTTS
jgi:hypothetical protein